jgi:YHS domain-containing protein
MAKLFPQSMSHGRFGMEIASPSIGEPGFSRRRRVAMQTKTCPVCGSDIKGSEVQAKVGGKEVTVCCSQCAKEIQEHPAQYAGATK